MNNYNEKTFLTNTDDFWNNDYEIDEPDINLDNLKSNKISSIIFSNSENYDDLFENINYNEQIKTKFSKIIEIRDVEKIDADTNAYTNSDTNSDTNTDTNMLEMELISKLNNKMTKDKKMSLIIAVLLQMIFGNNEIKLNRIYNFLNNNNLLDLDVVSNNYNGIRKSLSSLINPININSVEINSDDIKKKSNNNFQYSNYIENYFKNCNDNNNGDVIINDNKINDNKINDNKINDNKINDNKINDNFDNQKMLTYNKLSTNIMSNNKMFVNNKYRTNFNEIKLLGQGAYGSVYKVFHKYEKRYYAVKKVFITKEIIEDNYDIFREIQIYSDLMNDHVVRFYGSWIDIDVDSIIEYNNQIANDDEFDKIDYICPILFIQMELCDFTLKDYLLTWSEHDNLENKIDIIIQILYGLEYLCSKNIIHRDIKPDNIFLIKNKQNEYELNTYKVKIGDFGLCKKYIDINQNKNKCKTNKNNEHNSLLLNFNYKSMDEYVGTGIYRAPEIETKKYDFSIDIYSIGIIMIELFINFTTQSEKIILISKLKKSIDSTLLNKITNNEIKKIIIEMINLNPNKRPELKDILINLTNIIK